ncbi:lantibiotic ABC transporter permease [Methanolobus psychrotolerans]|uniref:lantibiotic ABC transporter permease n=1 Tax=Methanolobus psychrotolerans TaxID=1874706 RepID=UPI000B9154BD|nr:lantibiotic ABC transporter permease [Methanolobus psychrotolerans]
MQSKQTGTLIRIITLVTFLAMIIVNALANILPINGVSTGQVSDSYPNLFAPAGITFAIWGLIYLLLAGFTLYQLGIFQGNTNTNRSVNRSVNRSGLLHKTAILFSVSSLANAAWIFAWHYGLIPLSMLLMLVILVCLILITSTINKERLTTREYLFIRLPFSVYFGWITIATIANVTILLVSIGWKGFGLAETIWTVLVIIAGLIIAATTMLKNKDIAYGLVIIWAYAGILLKHISPEGFGSQYPSIITTTIVCILLLVLAEAYLVYMVSKRKSPVTTSQE